MGDQAAPTAADDPKVNAAHVGPCQNTPRTRGRFVELFLVLTSLVALPEAAQAQAFQQIAASQARPDAGSLQQQIDRERMPILPRETVRVRPVEAPAMKPSVGMTITVSAFHFAGNTLLSTDELAPAVAAYLNRPLNFDELQKAAASIANVYREAGWIVRTYLPEQDITEGNVTIQIVEAVFGGVQLEGAKPTRGSFERVVEMIEAQQKRGELLNADALDRALLIAGDQPDVTVSGTLGQGGDSHATNLIVKLSDKPMSSGEVNVDNNGSRSTGSKRGTANLVVNAPFGFGEQISVNVFHTLDSANPSRDGSDYGRLAVSLPIGLDGWRAGINGSYFAYNLIAPEFLALSASGTSATIGLDTNYPLIRARQRNLYVSGNFDHKMFDNQSLGAVTLMTPLDLIAL